MSMPKMFKYSLYTLGGILLLLILLIAGAILFIDPNDYRDRIEQAASSQLGREVQLNGPMSLSFFPWIGLEIQDVALANAQGFAPDTMLSVHKAGLKVKLLPLLSKNLQVGTLLLDGGQVHLAKNDQGVTNWQDLMASKSAKKPADQMGQDPSSGNGADSKGSGSPTGLAALSIEKITVTDTSLTWKDQQAGTQIMVQDLAVDIGPVSLEDPFPLSLSCTVDNAEPDLQAEIEATGKAQLDMQKRIVHLRDFDLTSRTAGEAIPGGETEITLQTSLSLNLETEALHMPQMALGAFGLQVTGQAEGTSMLTAPSVNGQLEVATFNPKKLVQRLDLPPLATADPEALTAVQAETGFEATPSSIALSGLSMGLDETSIQGRASVDLAQSVPSSNFSLQIDKIDVDRYLPPADAGGAQTAKKPETKTDKPGTEGETPAAALPVGLLRQLSAEGKIQIGEMKIKGMRLEDVSLTIQAQDGKIDIAPLTSRLYGGALESTASLDVRGQTPSIRTDTKLSTVRLESMLQDLTGKSLLSGLGSVHTAVSGQGLDAGSLLRTLDGSLNLNVENGAFQGTDILHRIRSTYLTLQGKSPGSSGSDQTKFSSLEVAADIAKGKIRKSDVQLISSLFSLQGSGQLDLVQRSMDYLLKVNFDKELSGQYPELSGLEGQEIPLDLQGTLTDPRVGLNKESLLKILGQGKLSEEVDKGVKKLQEKLGISSSENEESKGAGKQDAGEQVKDALKGFLGGGSSN